jgi:hypothetical protein
MALDVAQAALLVRVTARVSAGVFAAMLVVSARRLSAGGTLDQPRYRRADLACFALFLVAHSIHFAAVGGLAFASAGQNIRDAGGYAATAVVAIAFYVACGAVLRAKARTTARWTTTRERRVEVWTSGVLWIVFVQAYALRFVQSWLFAVLALVLTGSLALFAAAAVRHNRPQDARVML